MSVYATGHTIEALRREVEWRELSSGSAFKIGRLAFTVVPVDHSLIAPAVSYRATAGRVSFFYVPDLIGLPNPRSAPAGISLYIGDGASIVRPIVRVRDGTRIGHASISQQLEWCAQAKVPRAIFTHCGSQIVGGDPRSVEDRVRTLGSRHGVEARLAHDSMSTELTAARART